MTRYVSGDASVHPQLHPQPSVINLEHFREPRALKFVGVRQLDETQSEQEKETLLRFLTHLSRASLAISCALFLCQIAAAVCWCRPTVILGGILVSLLFLCQGILGSYVIKLFSQTLLVGYSCMSGFVALVGIGSAIYLLFGHFTLACISSFHKVNDQTHTRLRIVEVITLIAAIPCLLGAIACFLASVLSARASSKPVQNTPEPYLFLYMNSNKKEGTKERPHEQKEQVAQPTAPPNHLEVKHDPRARTPPPSYTQLSEEESFA